MANVDKEKGEMMNENFVKVYEIMESDKLEIVMQLGGQKRTMFRAMDEQVGKALERIEVNVNNANKKTVRSLAKKLKKSQIPDKLVKTIPRPTPNASLHDSDGNTIEPYVNNKQAWLQAKTLQICDKTYFIAHNPPSIESLRIVTSPIAGLSIHPQITLKHASMEYSKFIWYRKKVEQIHDKGSMDTNDDDQKSNDRKRPFDNSINEESDIQNDEEWESVSSDKIYKTTKDDFGFRIRLKVIPGNENFSPSKDNGQYQLEAAITASGVVQAGPDKCIFDDRHQLTKKRCKQGSFRFVCYNILADTYANTDFAREMLFPYCPLHAMHIDYRQQLIMQELCGYNADLICLQEVDRFVSESVIMPILSPKGFSGAFAAKDQIKEGVAMFFKKDKFRLLHIDNVIMRKAIKEERNSDLWSKVKQNEKYAQSFLSRANCILVALLQSVDDPDKHILLGNTHLYWHPRGGQIRLLQIEVLLRELRDTYKKFSHPKDGKPRDITTIVTGDFNSNPYTGVIDLLTKGTVPSYHSDWFTSGIHEHVSNIELHNPTKFESACGYPNYTNFVTSFNACLDYIFIEPKDLQVDRVIPQPSHNDITRYSALPNETAPSDHIAQVVDLTWVRQTENQT